MAVVFTSPMFPYQVGASPYNQAFSVQMNYGQMIREVTNWNPSVDPMTAGRMINNRLRQIIDRRYWYATKVRGVASVPNILTTGTCTVSKGSSTVTGIQTSWTKDLIGLQFRTSFTQAYQTIVNVDTLNQTLTLDTLYPGPDSTGGYQIALVYLTFGANVKRMKMAVNQLFGWAIEVNVPVEVINAKDVWRQTLGWATTFATRPPTPDGQYQVEVWPSPYAEQTFPFEAYTQPPNLSKDSEAVQAWIRPDVIVDGAIADALLFRTKDNSYYDVQAAITISASKQKMFEEEIARMELVDNDLDNQDVSWDFGGGSVANGYGSVYAQTHD